MAYTEISGERLATLITGTGNLASADQLMEMEPRPILNHRNLLVHGDINLKNVVLREEIELTDCVIMGKLDLSYAKIMALVMNSCQVETAIDLSKISADWISIKQLNARSPWVAILYTAGAAVDTFIDLDMSRVRVVTKPW